MNWIKYMCLVGLLLICHACVSYSFVSKELPEDINSMYIYFFPDNSSSPIDGLSSMIYDALVDRFIDRSRLQLANSEENADVILEGFIELYNTKPTIISASGNAQLVEVTITIDAKLYYNDTEKKIWEESFSSKETYDPNSLMVIEEEEEAAAEICSIIANNMFNKTVKGW